MTSARAASGFKTKGSRAEIVTPTEYSGSNTLEKYSQGVYVNDVSSLINPSTIQLRPNNDFLKIKDGAAVEVTAGSFDDTESPTPLAQVSGSVGPTPIYQKSQIPISFFSKSHPQGGKGSGFTVVPSHYHLDNDFGQPDIYQDGTAFEDYVGQVDPITVIETDPFELLVPFYAVNAADQTSMDGLVDVYDTRKKIERDLEIPFSMRGAWGDLGLSDTYRYSPLVVDQVETVSVRIKDDGISYSGTEPFLDAGNEFGVEDILGVDPSLFISSSRSPDGYVNPPNGSIIPFTEGVDGELTSEKVSADSDLEMRQVVLNLTGSRNYPTHDYLSRNHVSLAHGFDYDIGDSRIDSRAFGGLLK